MKSWTDKRSFWPKSGLHYIL